MNVFEFFYDDSVEDFTKTFKSIENLKVAYGIDVEEELIRILQQELNLVIRNQNE